MQPATQQRFRTKGQRNSGLLQSCTTSRADEPDKFALTAADNTAAKQDVDTAMYTTEKHLGSPTSLSLIEPFSGYP